MTTKAIVVALLLTPAMMPTVAHARDSGPSNVTSVSWCWVSSPMTLIRPCKKNQAGFPEGRRERKALERCGRLVPDAVALELVARSRRCKNRDLRDSDSIEPLTLRAKMVTGIGADSNDC